MIEQKIEKLIVAMDALTAALTKITVAANAMNAAPAEPAPEVKTAVPASAVPEPTPAPTPEVKTAAPAPEDPAPETKGDVTLDELHDLCLSMVRKDRGAKVNIAATIKQFGGELLKDVDPAKYPELKAALEAINA